MSDQMSEHPTFTLTPKPTRVKLTPPQAAEYLGFKLSYLYKLNTEHKVPFHKPSGGKVFYFQDDLDKYLEGGRVKSSRELELEAMDILAAKRAKRGSR